MWTARVRSRIYEVGESYSVLIFVGKVPEEESKWRESESYVGSVVCFVNSMAQECANCRANQDKSFEGFVDLTHYIKHYSPDHSLDDAAVTQYLAKEGFSWRIQKIVGAAEIAPSDLKYLEVTVMSTALHFSAGHRSFDMPKHHPNLTSDKAGGKGYVTV